MELMFLQRLSLAGDADERTIRRAYARELKLIDQEHDAAGFQSLREAYEAALFWVRNPEYFADDDGDGEEKPTQVQADAPPAPDVGGTEVIEATALPAEVLPADEEPQALGDEVFEEFVARLPALAAAAKGPIESETPWTQALQTCLDDLRLFGIDAREQFERRVAVLLAEGWRPGHEALLVAAVDTFGWAAERRHADRPGHRRTRIVRFAARRRSRRPAPAAATTARSRHAELARVGATGARTRDHDGTIPELVIHGGGRRHH